MKKVAYHPTRGKYKGESDPIYKLRSKLRWRIHRKWGFRKLKHVAGRAYPIKWRVTQANKVNRKWRAARHIERLRRAMAAATVRYNLDQDMILFGKLFEEGDND
jgi:hypothetical protein